jgi:glycosidase
MIFNSKIYEINTRIWIKQFGTLSTIPDEYSSCLKQKGIDLLWLMGIWKTNSSIIDKSCFENFLVNSYSKALKDWNKEDVIGSPYAIDTYEVNPALGSLDELFLFKEKLNSRGIKLILDFVPNHFNAESTVLKNHPEIFLQVDEEAYQRDSFTFFPSAYDNSKFFAHGRDPLFPAWSDTVQVNFFSDEAREYLTGILFNLINICDGVRCDMAMLPLNNVFKNSWLGIINKLNLQKPKEEFWKEAISKVKQKREDFLFIAEAYWDLEWELQQLGFDFTYDKRLCDRLSNDEIAGVKAHLTADNSFQRKSVRFIENHDEQRAAAKFGKYKSLAAATVISTVQGMKLYFNGQFEGKKIKLPVQLGREPEEKVSGSVKNYYNKLLRITKEKIFSEGEWFMLDPEPSAEGNYTNENIFSWEWKLDNERRIILINYSNSPSQCRIKFFLKNQDSQLSFKDLLTDEYYSRNASEIVNEGLFIDLKAYQSHIFGFTED